MGDRWRTELDLDHPVHQGYGSRPRPGDADKPFPVDKHARPSPHRLQSGVSQTAGGTSGSTQGRVRHRPRLLSDNGPGYISDELAKWLAGQGMEHIRGAPRHPQTQGKIERWHRTLENRILLKNHHLPGELEARIEAFVEHYNHRRYHESLENLIRSPADYLAAFVRLGIGGGW